MTLTVDLDDADVLWPDAACDARRLSIADGRIVDDPVGRRVDLSGYQVMPGIIDVHGDGFERHVAARRGAMKQLDQGLRAAEAELAASGITTGVLAQFISWEAGLRSPEFAAKVLSALRDVREASVTDLRGQVRLETHLTEVFADLPAQVADWGVHYVVFNDHLPHDKLASGRKPPRLNGQALRAGRSPEKHLALMQELHARDPKPALADLAGRLAAAGVRMGSHDDKTQACRAAWRDLGARICEFPETQAAAEAARAGGDMIVMGAPNIVRGGSHNGNASAIDLVVMGLCDALASDYHYPSLRRSALFLADAGVLDLRGAWDLISAGPARVLGLEDRGSLTVGKRADLVILDEARRVVATLSGGAVSYMSGPVAARFFNA